MNETANPTPILDEQEFSFLNEIERYDAFLRLYRSPDPADRETLRTLHKSANPLIPLILLQYLEEIPEKIAVMAILDLVEGEAEVVARSAMTAYQRNHYTGKARLLKHLVLSPSPLACRFAVRTLSRAGFMEILPLILRELPDRKGAVQAEMIDALRFLPNRRSIPLLSSLARSGMEEEPVRYLALQTLTALQPRLKALPIHFFVMRSRDESERIRHLAVEALQRFPSKSVAPMILETALKAGEPEESRVRAIRAMASFPSAQWLRPLVEVSANGDTQTLRLAAEISIRSFPVKILRKGLAPLLKDPESSVRQQAAVLLAEFLGEDPSIERTLLASWKGGNDERKMELIDALRALGSPSVEDILAEAAAKKGVLSYSTAAALAHLRGPGKAASRLLHENSLPALNRQVLLGRFARRSPEEAVKKELFPILLSDLESPVVNIRYLAVQALAWYPLEQTLGALSVLLELEKDGEVARTASRLILKGLLSDPRPLMAILKTRPRENVAVIRACRILGGARWDPAFAVEITRDLAVFLEGRPRLLAATLVRFLEQGTLPLEHLWPILQGKEPLFLRLLASGMRSSRRRFPPLPHEFLTRKLHGAEAPLRRLHYDLLAAEAGSRAIEELAGALVREEDPENRRAGLGHLKRLFLSAPGGI